MTLGIMILTAIASPSKVWAEKGDVVASGTCGDNLTWTLTENGETVNNSPAYDLTITGTGAMTDYRSSTMPWYSKITKITNVTIGSGVTTIGDDAFYFCRNLRSVSIPTSVTSIGDYAFYNCRLLRSITLPEGVTSIGDLAFECCTSLSSVTIGSGLTTIGEYAFSDCTDLVKITIDGGNSKYDSRNNCNAIIETTSNTLVVGCKGTIIPDGVTTIGVDAFNGSGLTSIDIPASVTTISSYAFDNCELLRSITLPEGLTSIGSMAFRSCKALKTIVIPDGVTTIIGGTFQGCDSLRRVTIGSGVTNIESRAFWNCKRLNVLHLKRYKPADEYNPVTKCDSYSSSKGSFEGCTGLSAIVVPEDGYNTYLDDEHFWNWRHLNRLYSNPFNVANIDELKRYGIDPTIIRPDHEVLLPAGTTWASWCDHIAHAAPEGVEVYTVDRMEGSTVYLNRITATVEDPDGGGLRALIPAYVPVFVKRVSGDLNTDLKMTYVSGCEMTPENGWEIYTLSEGAPSESNEVFVNNPANHIVLPDKMAELPYGYTSWLKYQRASKDYVPDGYQDRAWASFSGGTIWGNVGLCSLEFTQNYFFNIHGGAYTLDGDVLRDINQIDFGVYYVYENPTPYTNEPVTKPHRCTIAPNAAPGVSELTLCINSSTPMSVGFAKEGYGTYYHRGADATLPAGMKARIVTAKGSGGALTYETIADGSTAENTVPAGTAVMLQVAESTNAQTLTIDLTAKEDNRTFASNFLYGSDVATTTDGGGEGAKYYKLSYGQAGSANENVFGWYWGAQDGATFTSAAHKAWLALPAGEAAISLRLPDFEEEVPTAIDHSTLTIDHYDDAWYTMDGRKLNGEPTAPGLYINNGKKIMVK